MIVIVIAVVKSGLSTWVECKDAVVKLAGRTMVDVKVVMQGVGWEAYEGG